MFSDFRLFCFVLFCFVLFFFFFFFFVFFVSLCLLCIGSFFFGVVVGCGVWSFSFCLERRWLSRCPVLFSFDLFFIFCFPPFP